MNTIEDLFKSFDADRGTSAVAEALKVGLSTASEMRRRGSIPVRYWPLLVSEGEKRSLPISYDVLVHIHAKSREKRAQAPTQAGAA